MNRDSLETRAEALHRRACQVVDDTAAMLVSLSRLPGGADLGPWLLALVALRLQAVGAVRELECLRDGCGGLLSTRPEGRSSTSADWRVRRGPRRIPHSSQVT